MTNPSEPRYLRAFVSSTYVDLREHRAFVIDQLRNSGLAVDPMEVWTADSDEPKVFSQQRIEGCDLCVLLVGFRRGWHADAQHHRLLRRRPDELRHAPCRGGTDAAQGSYLGRAGANPLSRRRGTILSRDGDNGRNAIAALTE